MDRGEGRCKCPGIGMQGADTLCRHHVTSTFMGVSGVVSWGLVRAGSAGVGPTLRPLFRSQCLGQGTWACHHTHCARSWM